MPIAKVNRSFLIVLILGCLVSAGVFLWLKGWEEDKRFQDFQHKALGHAAAIETEFEHISQRLSDVRALIEYEIVQQHNPLEAKSFMPLVEKILGDDKALLSIAWAVLEHAPKSPSQYLKVVTVKSALSSDADGKENYEQYLQTVLDLEKTDVVQAFMHQDHGTTSEQELSFIVYVGQNFRTEKSLPKHVLGALIIELDVHQVIERALAKVPVAAEDISLLMLQADGHEHLLYKHTSRSRNFSEMNVQTGLSGEQHISFSGRQWLIAFDAAPQFMRTYPIVLAWIALIFCLLITFLLAYYLRYKGMQAAMVENEVIHRTKEFKEAQALLNAVLSHSPAVISIKDLHGKYILVNTSYENLFHTSDKAMQGKSDADMFDAELAQSLREHDLTVIESGKAVVLEESIPDERGMRSYYSLRFPLRDEVGNIYAVCSILTDITETKKSSEQLAKLAIVIEQTDEMVVVTDNQGLIEYVNPAFERISGYVLDELMGEKPSIVKSGKHSEKFYQAMWAALLAGEIWKADFTNRNKQGQLYVVSQTITPIMNAENQLIGFASVQRDVTDQRAMQRKLQHSDRVESLGLLAGGIAHDFNNLLTAILGHTSLAVKKVSDNPKVLKHLGAVETASLSAADLCKQMLAYAGKGQFVVQLINLSELVEKMTKLLDVSREKNIELNYHLLDDLAAIEADIAQIQQVILNLITNASEAMNGDAGCITVSTGVMHADMDYLNHCVSGEHQEGSYVYLEVQDTGCGMDENTRDKIFDPFFTTKFTGRGLGMSAMLGIVQAHHGILHIDSKIGEGTAIRVAFPMSNESLQHEKSPKARAQLQTTGMVLIIDDEESIRDVVQGMFEELGYQVLMASDGEHGIDIFKQHQHEISLVLLDMTMPKMNGVACFRALKVLDKHVRVILSSGYNEQEEVHRLMDEGLLGFIQKPYSAHTLTEKLHEYL